MSFALSIPLGKDGIVDSHLLNLAMTTFSLLLMHAKLTLSDVFAFEHFCYFHFPSRECRDLFILVSVLT